MTPTPHTTPRRHKHFLSVIPIPAFQHPIIPRFSAHRPPTPDLPTLSLSALSFSLSSFQTPPPETFAYPPAPPATTPFQSIGWPVRAFRSQDSSDPCCAGHSHEEDWSSICKIRWIFVNRGGILKSRGAFAWAAKPIRQGEQGGVVPEMDGGR